MLVPRVTLPERAPAPAPFVAACAAALFFATRAMAEAAESGQQILVRFVTPVAALRVDEAAIAVPAELNRTGLSAVVNHLRGADSEDLYEFYAVAGPEGSAVVPPGRVLLRTSLRKYLRTLGVSVEATVTLEYTPAATPPQPGPTKETTDWISAIAGSDK